MWIFRGECHATSSLGGSDRSAKTMFLSGKKEEGRDGGREVKEDKRGGGMAKKEEEEKKE